jgi:hypothetical protein
MPIDTLIAYIGIYSDVDEALEDYAAIKDLHSEEGLMDASTRLVESARRRQGRVASSRALARPAADLPVGSAGHRPRHRAFPARSAPASGWGDRRRSHPAWATYAAGMSRHDLKELGEQLDTPPADLRGQHMRPRSTGPWPMPRRRSRRPWKLTGSSREDAEDAGQGRQRSGQGRHLSQPVEASTGALEREGVGHVATLGLSARPPWGS